MDSPTAWNVNDKSDVLSVNSDGLRVVHTGEDIDTSCCITVEILLFLYFIL